MKNASDSPASARTMILQILKDADAPVPKSKIRKIVARELNYGEDELNTALGKLIFCGEVFRFAPYRSDTPRYWHASPEVYARQVILEILADSSLSYAALEKKIATRLSDCSLEQRKKVVDQMVKAQELFLLPPLGSEKSILYSAKPPRIEDYLGPIIDIFVDQIHQTVKRLAYSGIAPEEIFKVTSQMVSASLNVTESSAPMEMSNVTVGVEPPVSQISLPAMDTHEFLLTQVRTLLSKSRHGGLISIRELRFKVRDQIPDKENFDNAMISLSESGKLWLFRHDYALSLSAAEREVLVTDQKGNFYNGVLLKDEH